MLVRGVLCATSVALSPDSEKIAALNDGPATPPSSDRCPLIKVSVPLSGIVNRMPRKKRVQLRSLSVVLLFPRVATYAIRGKLEDATICAGVVPNLYSPMSKHELASHSAFM